MRDTPVRCKFDRPAAKGVARARGEGWVGVPPAMPNSLPCNAASLRLGYTLVELLLATLLTLLMMGVVVSVFASIGQSVTDTRALVEIQNQLRSTANRLRQDLEEATAPMRPPLRPEAGQGYFEIIEGPNGVFWTPTGGPASPAWDVPMDSDAAAFDTTAGDNDDILMFTIRSRDEPMVGRWRLPNGTLGTIESREAEVAWFVRGRTLYRRVLLVAPGKFNALDANGDGVVTPAEAGLGGDSVFQWYDVSVRPAASQSGTPGMIANTLGDLTKPEYRYVHQAPAFPYHPHWVANRRTNVLGLPLLAECSAATFFNAWVGGTMPGVSLSLRPGEVLDLWRNPHPWNETDRDTGILAAYAGPRVGEEAILNNVLAFDVKVYDPDAPVVPNAAGDGALVPGDPGYAAALSNSWISRGAYVDLGYGFGIAQSPPPNLPAALVQSLPGLSPFAGPGRYYPVVEPTYDTWSTHYENNWIDVNQNGVRDTGDWGDENRNGLFDEGTNGLDDNGDGVVDDPLEQEAPPPYPHPLRGIKVTIRVFEPDTRQIRQVTIIHHFLSK